VETPERLDLPGAPRAPAQVPLEARALRRSQLAVVECIEPSPDQPADHVRVLVPG
jgi:hypothetical protein